MSQSAAKLEAAAREWATGPDSQAVVAERHGLCKVRLNWMIRKLDLRKPRSRTKTRTPRKAAELYGPDAPAEQAKLDAAMRAQTLRLIEVSNRRRAAAAEEFGLRRHG